MTAPDWPGVRVHGGPPFEPGACPQAVCGIPYPVEVQLAVAGGPVVPWPPGMPLPRAGERVQLEDGSSTWVRDVSFTLGESPLVVISAGPLEAYVPVPVPVPFP